MTEKFPRSRFECVEGPRPCPFLSCRYHLRQRAPGAETCALDVAEKGEQTQNDVAQLLGLSVSRIQSIEQRAMFKARPLLVLIGRVEPAEPVSECAKVEIK